MDTKINLYFGHGLDLIPEREAHKIVKEMKKWLKFSNVKYTFNYNPNWSILPCSITMSSENATAFRLKFNQ